MATDSWSGTVRSLPTAVTLPVRLEFEHEKNVDGDNVRIAAAIEIGGVKFVQVITTDLSAPIPSQAKSLIKAHIEVATKAEEYAARKIPTLLQAADSVVDWLDHQSECPFCDAERDERDQTIYHGETCSLGILEGEIREVGYRE